MANFNTKATIGVVADPILASKSDPCIYCRWSKTSNINQ